MSNQYAQVEKGTNRIGAWFLQTIKPAETDTHYYALIEPQFSFKTSPRPSTTSFLELVNGKPTWIETATLEEAKVIAWERVKTKRDEAEAAPFEFEGDLYDANKENVLGAAFSAHLAILAGQDVADEWTLADNSKKILSGQQFVVMGITLANQVKTVHAKGRHIRALIDNATTAEEALSYTWETE